MQWAETNGLLVGWLQLGSVECFRALPGEGGIEVSSSCRVVAERRMKEA